MFTLIFVVDEMWMHCLFVFIGVFLKESFVINCNSDTRDAAVDPRLHGVKRSLVFSDEFDPKKSKVDEKN